MNKKVLGVIGGMGTAATIDFYTRIMNHTVAHKDQETYRYGNNKPCINNR